MENSSGDSTAAPRKRVLVIRNAFVSDFGGAERLIVHLAQELQLNKVDPIVLSRQPRLLAYAEEKGVPHYRGWWWSQQNWSGKRVALVPAYLGWQLILTIWYLQLIIRLKPDVVHAMSKDDFIAGTIAARMLGKRVIWTDTADLKFVYRNLGVWYKNPVGKLVWLVSRLPNAVLLVSQNEKRLVTEAAGRPMPPHYTVLHQAGKDEQVTALERQPTDRDAVIFCSTSRLVTDKGIGELVNAFNVLSADTDEYRLWLVGDGPEQDRFKAMAEGNKHITFVGHTNQPLTYLAASDIFVQPTYHEAFSLSITEAAMLGKPMIVTEVGGNPEIVNDKNGRLVPVKDVDKLLAAMKELGNDATLRQKLGAQAREDYVENFDFAHIIKTKLLPLYG